jgi:peptidoglycan/LPS O-acetylase OafA/YrhL
MKRIRGFDGLRALAVSCVFVGHMRQLDVPLSAVAVYVFFVLSGFLITGILTDQREAIEKERTTASSEMLSFYYRRSLRIFPVYYLTLFACSAWVWASTGESPPGLWSYVVYVSNIWMSVNDSCHVLLCHFWSLAIEEQFYVFLAPLLIFVPARRHLAVVLGVFALGTASLFVAPMFGLSSREQYALSTTNFALLAAGGVMALLYRRRPELRVPGFAAAAGSVVVLAFVVLSAPLRAHSASGFLVLFWTTIVGIALAVAWIVQHQDAAVVQWLEWRPMAYLGTVSYGFYLVHPAVIHAYRGLVHWPAAEGLTKGLQAATNALACFAITFLISHVSWQFFEKRILKLRDLPRFGVLGPAASESRAR